MKPLVRGQNLVGHRNYADDAVELFVATAASLGVDVFRVFDPLNDLRNMEVAIKAARKASPLKARASRRRTYSLRDKPRRPAQASTAAMTSSGTSRISMSVMRAFK